VRDCAHTIKLITSAFHLVCVTESQPEIILAQLDLADETFELSGLQAIPQAQVLEVILDFYLI
jgi:hypothetical protein